jgi:hypothetical protein
MAVIQIVLTDQEKKQIEVYKKKHNLTYKEMLTQQTKTM